ncbi:MAG: CPBP family intramembrane metalloprotease [Thermoplasmatales archaeon]|nr:MAG: CPBP family intramembrane metalloprotease [Thermoplasmatales archaeon]
MLVPLLIPIFYCIKYKKEALWDILVIAFTMILIVIFYWPLTLEITSDANFYVKFLLFVLLPTILLFIWGKMSSKSDKNSFNWKQFGISGDGVEKSLKWGFIFLPLMLVTTFIVKYFIGNSFEANYVLGVISFVESFTEEFFFRGVLFLFLCSKTNLKIAYVTSLASFVLMHPQNFNNLFIISTIVQGLLTVEICRRSKNLIGAWVLHGTNRFFTIVILAFLL